MAVALAIIVGVNVGLFIHLASLSSVLDPDPPFAPGEVGGLPFHVGTYNIWNHNNYWDVRKLRIAEVIRDAQLDIVGLQEVRNVQHLGGNQLDHLTELLPEYPYSIFHSAHIAKRQKRINLRVHDPEEGVALLSKHPIVYNETFTLTTVSGSEDENVRVVILAHVEVPKLGLVYFFVTHLSFVPTIQCRHVFELLRIIRSLDLDPNRPKIVVGDFNIFPDWEDPAAFFDRDWTEVERENRCWEIASGENLDWSTAAVRGNTHRLTDVWSLLRPGDPGFTFSNLPWAEHTHTYPARPTRPDRIYVSGLAHGASSAVPHGVVPRRIVRQEDGSQYRRLYYWRLMAHRTRHLVRTLIEPASNHNPYYTYARVYSDFYQPLLDLWHGAPAEQEEGELSAEEENLQAVLASVEVDEFGAIVATTASSTTTTMRVKQKAKKKGGNHRSGATAKPRRDEGYDDDEEGSPEGLLDVLWSAYEAVDPSPRLLGFAVHRLLWDVPSHLPLYAIAVAPTALLSVIALASLCGCCGCPLHRPRKKGHHHHRTTHRQRCLRLLCGCLALALLVAVAVALSAAVFLLPILFTGYIDDLVPSDHRLVVASFSY